MWISNFVVLTPKNVTNCTRLQHTDIFISKSKTWYHLDQNLPPPRSLKTKGESSQPEIHARLQQGISRISRNNSLISIKIRTYRNSFFWAKRLSCVKFQKLGPGRFTDQAAFRKTITYLPNEWLITVFEEQPLALTGLLISVNLL